MLFKQPVPDSSAHLPQPSENSLNAAEMRQFGVFIGENWFLEGAWMLVANSEIPKACPN